jgi:hypothetical protein
VASLSRPLAAVRGRAYLVVGLHHFRLGVTTLIEDYVRGLARKIWIIAMTIVSYGSPRRGSWHWLKSRCERDNHAMKDMMNIDGKLRHHRTQLRRGRGRRRAAPACARRWGWRNRG